MIRGVIPYFMEMMILTEFSESDKEFLENVVSDAFGSVSESISELTRIESDIFSESDFVGECLFMLMIGVCFLWGSVLYISYVQRGLK